MRDARTEEETCEYARGKGDEDVDSKGWRFRGWGGYISVCDPVLERVGYLCLTFVRTLVDQYYTHFAFENFTAATSNSRACYFFLSSSVYLALRLHINWTAVRL